MEEITELHNCLFTDVCAVIKSAHLAEYNATGLVINTSDITAEQLQREMEQYNGKCLGYVVDESIVGTLSVFCEKKRYWFSAGRDVKTIKYVAVRPDYQGRHVASKLLQYAKDVYANNTVPIIVSTDQKNKHAIKLYEKNGFQIMKVTRGRKADSNALKLVWWPLGCPFSHSLCSFHLLMDKIKCAIKIIIRY